ncbi:MAG: Yip1 domain protein [ANME-2 cluster archaeon HR1]|nr:MAG: Yip1 domain protein [ANME-2 cluster archaeon HR1]
MDAPNIGLGMPRTCNPVVARPGLKYRRRVKEISIDIFQRVFKNFLIVYQFDKKREVRNIMIDKFVNTWKSVIFQPNNFFKNMPTSGGYGDPLVFAFINSIIYAIITYISTLVQMRSLGIMPDFMVAISYIISLINLITTPIFFIIELFIGAAIYFVCFKIVGGSGSYEGTFRILAYTSVVAVISGVLLLILVFIIPYPSMNQMIGIITNTAGLREYMQYAVYSVVFVLITIYTIYLMSSGGKYVHDISILKSIIAAILPYIVIGLTVFFRYYYFNFIIGHG